MVQNHKEIASRYLKLIIYQGFSLGRSHTGKVTKTEEKQKHAVLFIILTFWSKLLLYITVLYQNEKLHNANRIVHF